MTKVNARVGCARTASLSSVRHSPQTNFFKATVNIVTYVLVSAIVAMAMASHFFDDQRSADVAYWHVADIFPTSA